MFHEFLEAVSEDVEEGGDKNKVKEFLSQHKSEKASVVNGCQEKQKEIRTQLVKALDNKEFDEVLKLIVEDNGENAKTLQTLNDNAKAIAQRERKRTACLCQCGQGCRDCSKEEIDSFLSKCCNKIKNTCNCSCCCQGEQQHRENLSCCNCMQPRSCECGKTIKRLCDWLCFRQDEQQTMENFDEEEREWIRILSDPLYISLKWFWRIYTKPSGSASTSLKDEGKRRENEEQDVIVAALRDSHLLQMIASNNLRHNKKEYQGRADEIEEFAIAVVEGSTHEQLRDIMDTQGGGCLKQDKPENFSQSLSVLKIAADLERIKFVASGKCQTILNEVIYFQWRGWQKKNRTPKILWSIVQLLLFTIPGIPLVYMILRLSKECCGVIATYQECRPGIGMGEGQRGCCVSCRCDKYDGCCGVFRLLFEHPYSKFVNHTMFYLVFLGFLIAASFEEEFGTTDTGLVWIDWVILGFVVGLLVQEFLEFWREGCFVYFSKWWNVVDTMIILLFASAYSIWLISFAYYGKQWKPEKISFIIADVFFSSGIAMAFFHLTHIFQVDSVLGPLQLSLYRMLRDIWKFLLLFLLLYISFATGLTKMYSYYVASQIKLEQRNMTHYEKWHPYADHVNTGRDLFWLFLGVFDENKIVVKDPAFHAVSLVGHLFIIVYAVCMVIVALNMLIAMMSKSFEDIKEDSDIWKFSRTRMWLESIDKGNVLPAPVNLIYYGLKIISILFYVTVIKWFIKYFSPCCRCSQKDEEQGKKYSETDEHRLRTMKKLVMKFLEDGYTKEGKDKTRARDHNNKKGKHPVGVELKSQKVADQGQRIGAQINPGFAYNLS
ncbi:short transient receptor potential channel 6-like [Montipora capricornis]|uniref:short transient receptor potential channel 6-like n=1 Tax=Montipora capricornis TaxID=246305 RepID=UPI0035F1F424